MSFIFGFAKLVPTQSELIILKILSLQKKIHLSFFLYVFAESFIESYCVVNGSISPPAADDRNCTKKTMHVLTRWSEKSVFGAHESPSEILLLGDPLTGSSQ